MKLPAAILYLLFVISVPGSCSCQTKEEDPISASRTWVMQLMKEQHIPGASIAVSSKGKIVWNEAFGYADIDSTTRINADTKFRIGSVSKTITCVGLVKLAENKKIDLDRSVQTYVPSFPATNTTLTIRQLAGHTSGIRHYSSLPSDQLHPEHYTSVTASLIIFQNDSLLFQPDSKFSYSTYAYTLLSAAMETASQQTFTQYIRQQVLQPLNMTNTTPDYTDSSINNKSGYFLYSNSTQQIVTAPFEDLSYKWAGGGYLSTAADLVKLGDAIIEGKFLTKEGKSLFKTSQKLSNGELTNYSYGLRLGKDSKGRRIMHHGGVAYGGRAFLLIYPDQDLVIAITTNQGDAKFDQRNLEAVANLFIR